MVCIGTNGHRTLTHIYGIVENIRDITSQRNENYKRVAIDIQNIDGTHTCLTEDLDFKFQKLMKPGDTVLAMCKESHYIKNDMIMRSYELREIILVSKGVARSKRLQLHSCETYQSPSKKMKKKPFDKEKDPFQ